MKKKGFTLVELLAVIAILAVILVIAVPKVLDSIDQSKKKSFFSSAKSIVRTIDYNNLDELSLTETPLSSLNLTGISTDDYDLTTSTAYIIDDDVYLNLVGKGKFEGLYVCEFNEGSGDNTVQGSPCIVYKESILNGAYPRITEGMIPITIANTGVVTTVDPTSSNWYSYSTKKWANVVLVKENGTKTREYYETNYNVTVAEDDILAYLVWIPRYRYTLWNVAGTAATYTGGCTNTSYYSQSTCTANAGTWTEPSCSANCPRSISITFESAYTTKSTGTTNGAQLTHPAFTYDGVELNGIWVGKFETTPIAGSACAASPSKTNCLNVNPTIKPNTASLRAQDVSTKFNTSLLFGTNSMYGLSGESRMSKNSDWGAVAYLSHSVYGINTEIRINNNLGYITGCGSSVSHGASTSTCEISYLSSVGSYPQSTTGNKSGIFDMSGGAYEYQMGVFASTSNEKYSGLCDYYNSGFKGLYGNPSGNANCNSSIISNTTGADYPSSKYYKLYIDMNWQNHLGEALGETSGWYKDNNYVVLASVPWFTRGGGFSLGFKSGSFAFQSYWGNYSTDNSFRTIVTTH